MKLKITGKNMEVTDGMREAIEKKLGKLDKYSYFDDSTVGNVLVRTVKDDQIIEFVAVNKGKTIRAEERDKDLYVAIDELEDTLKRKIRKAKEKRIDKRQRAANEFEAYKHSTEFMVQNPPYDTQPIVIENPPYEAVVRHKVIEPEMMLDDEAIEQIELLGHDFYIYIDAETGRTCVIYKRKDGNYGKIDVARK